MTAEGPGNVPFAGLRRNAPALAGGLLPVLGLFLFVPDIAPRPSDLPRVQLAHGRIVEVMPTTDPGTPDVRVEVLDSVEDGPH